MQATTTYLDRVRPAIEEVGERFATLVSAAPDPSLRIRHSDWTVSEATAHVVTVAPRQDLAALGDQVAGYGLAPPSFRFHGGELVPADVALGILLGELVVHGWDIAQAVHQPWPIDPGHVALILEGLVPIVPGWVDPQRARGLTATFEVRLRGQTTHVFWFQDGRLQVNPARERPIDAHISADPAALLLVLYRRQSQWRHIAQGRLMAWGRKPWLALSFTGRFHKP